MLFLMLESS